MNKDQAREVQKRPRVVSKNKVGGRRSNADTPNMFIQLRSYMAQRSLRVKPSMPKMPWEK